MKPQTRRVLARLREGPVSSMDFAAPRVCDGGRPVTRVAPRILELREFGFEIRAERAANGTSIYTLVGEPDSLAAIPQPAGAIVAGESAAAPAESLPPAAGAGLFDADLFTVHGDYRDVAA